MSTASAELAVSSESPQKKRRMADQSRQIPISSILELPTELLLHITTFLDLDDVLVFRASCRRFLEICADFMRFQTFHVEYCRFPGDLLGVNVHVGQESIRFGEVVQYGLNGNEAFLREFCRNFKCLTFKASPVFELLEYFPDLEELNLTLPKHFHFTEYSYLEQIRELMRRNLSHVRRFTVNYPDMDERQLNIFLETMPNLESVDFVSNENMSRLIEPDLQPGGMNNNILRLNLVLGRIRERRAPTTEFCSIPIEFVQHRASRLQSLNCGLTDPAMLTTLIGMSDLKLKGFTCKIEGDSHELLNQFFSQQLDLVHVSIHFFSQTPSTFVNFMTGSLVQLRTLTLIGRIPELKGLKLIRHLKHLEQLNLLGGEAQYFHSAFHVAHGLNENNRLSLRSLSIKRSEPTRGAPVSGPLPARSTICTDCWKKITVCCPNLTTLNVTGMELSVRSYHYIFMNLTLKSLTLTSCRVRDECFRVSGFPTQTRLRRLTIADNKIPELTAIPRLENLRKLDITGTKISSIHLSPDLFPNLRSLLLPQVQFAPLCDSDVRHLSVTTLVVSGDGLRFPWTEVQTLYPHLRVLVGRQWYTGERESERVDGLFYANPDLECAQFVGQGGFVRYRSDVRCKNRNWVIPQVAENSGSCIQ